jgi:hypothetical protein
MSSIQVMPIPTARMSSVTMQGASEETVLQSVGFMALPMLSEWLEPYFAWAEWAAPVAGLLLIAGKVVEVVQARRAVSAPPPGVAAAGAAPENVVEVPAPPSLWWV